MAAFQFSETRLTVIVEGSTNLEYLCIVLLRVYRANLAIAEINGGLRRFELPASNRRILEVIKDTLYEFLCF